MKILISCYACEPFKGSEPGVGWNLSVALAKKNRIVVLTRKNNKSVIEKYLNLHPIDNIDFIYHDLPVWLMWVKKLLGTQIYYLLWNLTAIRVVKRYTKRHGIDIFHHLTFNQYRTISAGYFMNKPFVIGPIGGAEIINPVFDAELEPSTLKREIYRRSGKDFWIFKWLNGQKTNKKVYLFSAAENKSRLEQYVDKYRDIVKVLPAIAIDKNDFAIEPKENNNHTFTMLYAGRAIDWKGLHVFLKALACCSDKLPEYKVLLIGIRSEKERKTVIEWLEAYHLSHKIELIDFMPRSELLQRLNDVHLFVYPAFRDSGSMAVLEACAMGCPSVVFNVGGQDAFHDDVLIKIKVQDTLEKTIEVLAEKICWAYNHPKELMTIGRSAREFALTKMTWDRKADIISDIYYQIIDTSME